MIRIRGVHSKGVESLLLNSQLPDSKLSRVITVTTMIDLDRRLFTHLGGANSNNFMKLICIMNEIK
jgi:hypothetical protein